MASTITNDVQVLLDQARGQGMTVSCYADASVTQGFEPHWLQPFKTEAGRARERLAGDRQARLELDRNLDAVRQALESPEARRARHGGLQRGAARVLPGGAFRSVAALEAAIMEYLANHNENPRPFVWTANADLILERVKKVCERISNSGH